MASGTRARGIVPGTPIVAADVNANFSALADAPAERQLRVDGECPSGSAIRVIDADGGVTCQAVTGEGETLGGVESVSARTPTRTAVSMQQAAWSSKTRLTVSAGVIGSSALMASCPEGYVATGGGAFVSGLIRREEVAYLSTRPHTTNPRSW